MGCTSRETTPETPPSSRSDEHNTEDTSAAVSKCAREKELPTKSSKRSLIIFHSITFTCLFYF